MTDSYYFRRPDGSLVELFERSDSAAKPDGWHTYHVCDGRLRNISWTGLEAMCAFCGQWFEARVTDGTQSEVPSTQR